MKLWLHEQRKTSQISSPRALPAARWCHQHPQSCCMIQNDWQPSRVRRKGMGRAGEGLGPLPASHQVDFNRLWLLKKKLYETQELLPPTLLPKLWKWVIILEMAGHRDLQPCCIHAEIHRVVFLRLEGGKNFALHSPQGKSLQADERPPCSRVRAPGPRPRPQAPTDWKNYYVSRVSLF